MQIQRIPESSFIEVTVEIEGKPVTIRSLTNRAVIEMLQTQNPDSAIVFVEPHHDLVIIKGVSGVASYETQDPGKGLMMLLNIDQIDEVSGSVNLPIEGGKPCDE